MNKEIKNEELKKEKKLKNENKVKNDKIITVFNAENVSNGVYSAGAKKIKNNKNLEKKTSKEKPSKEVASKEANKKTLKIVFLGGVGEIGKNMTAFEYGNDIIVVDAGAAFPTNDLPGIDLVVPDISYLTKNKNRVRGVVITHGHEDHIGGVPYLLKGLNVPIYGSNMAIALIENKLKEHKSIKNPQLINVKENAVIKLGAFTVEFIKVNHSIAGAFALKIACPGGVVFHTGDFKIDLTPIYETTTNLTRIAEIGTEGVDLLMCESTNVERPGFSMSERTVGTTLDNLFEKYIDDRLIVATFASNIYRLQQLLTLAEKYNRRVVFTGRSMINVSETASKLGVMKYDKNNIIDIDKMKSFPDKEILIISTGSQGEPNSALVRMANGEFPKMQLSNHDTVILSSSPIPGNEKNVSNVMNRLYKAGCNVVYNELADVHASGHACKEEIKIIHNLIKPKFFMPIHGEYRHLKHHKDLALEQGMDERNIYIAEIGDKVELKKTSLKKIETVKAGNRLVDGLGVGDESSVVLRDRKQLSEDGICVVIVGVNLLTGEITSEPDIISRGLIYSNEVEKLILEAKAVVTTTIQNAPLKDMDINLLNSNIRSNLVNFFYRKTKRRPMTLVSVMEMNG